MIRKLLFTVFLVSGSLAVAGKNNNNDVQSRNFASKKKRTQEEYLPKPTGSTKKRQTKKGPNASSQEKDVQDEQEAGTALTNLTDELAFISMIQRFHDYSCHFEAHVKSTPQEGTIELSSIEKTLINTKSGLKYVVVSGKKTIF